MAIQFIDNQPITFKTDWETDSECKTSYDRACTLYSTDDYIYAQFKQTPCGDGDNLICDTDFSNPNTEAITNGTFDTDATGWTLSGCTYDSLNSCVAFSSNGDYLKQSISPFTFSTKYELRFTLSSATQGNVKVYAGPNLIDPGYTLTSGTYFITFDWIDLSDELKFVGDNYNGCIDNISIKESSLINNTCWQVGDILNWIVNNNETITKISGTADYLASPLSNIIIGGYYRFDLTVTSMTQGTVTIKDALGMTIGTISANGSYSFYWNVPVGQVFTYYADAEFDGTLSGFGLVEYGNNFSFQLTDGTNTFDISDQAEYFQDWVTLKADASSITPGCYQLVVYDACSITVPEPMNNEADLTTAGSEWNSLNGYNANITYSGSGLLKIDATGTPINSYAGLDIQNTGLT